MEEFNYQVSDDAVELAKHHEGFRARAYLDPIGIPTIGYGLTRYFHRPGAPKVKMGDVITEDEASFALAATMQSFFDQAAAATTVKLEQFQVDALASFIYNVGVANFRNSTMLRLINAGDFDGAARQFPRWNKAGGKVLPGLTRRRNDEMLMFMGE